MVGLVPRLSGLISAPLECHLLDVVLGFGVVVGGEQSIERLAMHEVRADCFGEAQWAANRELLKPEPPNAEPWSR